MRGPWSGPEDAWGDGGCIAASRRTCGIRKGRGEAGIRRMLDRVVSVGGVVMYERKGQGSVSIAMFYGALDVFCL